MIRADFHTEWFIGGRYRQPKVRRFMSEGAVLGRVIKTDLVKCPEPNREGH